MGKVMTVWAWTKHNRLLDAVKQSQDAVRQEGDRVVRGDGDREELDRRIRVYLQNEQDYRQWIGEYSTTTFDS